VSTALSEIGVTSRRSSTCTDFKGAPPKARDDWARPKWEIGGNPCKDKDHSDTEARRIKVGGLATAFYSAGNGTVFQTSRESPISNSCRLSMLAADQSSKACSILLIRLIDESWPTVVI